MVMANFPCVWALRLTGMRETVVPGPPFIASDHDIADSFKLVDIHTAAIGEFRIVFALVQELDEELYDVGIVFGEVDLAFLRFLTATS